MGFHKYCNCDFVSNEKIDNYIINYVKNMSKKKRKGLRKISFRKEVVLDFYYHINGKTTLTPYYVMAVFYYYKKNSRCYQFRVYEKDLV